MQGRTQDLRFGRSRVHAWGLFAKQDIEPEQFMIEYMGEVCINNTFCNEPVPMTACVVTHLLRQQVFTASEVARPNLH